MVSFGTRTAGSDGDIEGDGSGTSESGPDTGDRVGSGGTTTGSLCFELFVPAGVIGRVLDGVAGRDDEGCDGVLVADVDAVALLRSRVEDLTSAEVPAVEPDRCCRVPVAVLVRRLAVREAEGNGCEVLV